MPHCLERDARGPFAGLGVPQTFACLGFFASVPIWHPLLDVAPWLFSATEATNNAVDVPFLPTMSLTAMFTALTMLFVCLIRTAYARIGTNLLRSGAVAYMLAYIAVAAIPRSTPDPLESLLGALLGCGGTIVCFAWALRLSWPDCRASLRGILCLLTAGWALNTVLFLLVPPFVARAVLCVVACAATLGTVLTGIAGTIGAPAPIGAVGAADAPVSPQTAARRNPPCKNATDGLPAANWWDVFGRLDTAGLSTGEEHEAPASRILFFVATPLLVLLLAIANVAAHIPEDERVGSLGSTSIASFGLALVACLPLLAVRTNRGLINTSFRLYLPLAAVVVLACAAFSDNSVRHVVLREGIGLWCTLYAICLFALVLSMPGRMRSLCLPCASFVVLALNLVALLASSPTEMPHTADALGPLSFFCLVGAVTLLATQPSSRLWFVMMDLIPAESAPAVQDCTESAPAARIAAIIQTCGLTEREAQVFPYLVRGHGAAYIAEALRVSESTVRSHRSNIYRKLGVSSREGLIALVERDAKNNR